MATRLQQPKERKPAKVAQATLILTKVKLTNWRELEERLEQTVQLFDQRQIEEPRMTDGSETIWFELMTCVGALRCSRDTSQLHHLAGEGSSPGLGASPPIPYPRGPSILFPVRGMQVKWGGVNHIF